MAVVKLKAETDVRKTVLSSSWAIAIEETGMDQADNSGSTIVNVSSITSDSTRNLISVGRYNNVIVCLKYDDDITTFTTAPVIQCFGSDGSGVWMPVENGAGQTEVTIADTADDVTDGTDFYTRVNYQSGASVFPTLGATRLIFGVKTAAVSAGDDSLVSLLVRLV